MTHCNGMYCLDDFRICVNYVLAFKCVIYNLKQNKCKTINYCLLNGPGVAQSDNKFNRLSSRNTVCLLFGLSPGDVGCSPADRRGEGQLK